VSTRLRWGVFGVVLVVVAALPQVLEAGMVNRLSEVLWVAVAALGLALLTGYNGQISLGHGAFVGLGAYVTMILTVDYGVPFALAGLVAVAAAFVVGVGVGLPALRITGVYLALVTLGLAVLFPQLVVRFGDITGGTVGRQLIPRPGYGDSALIEEIGQRRYLGQAGFRAPEWTGLADDQWRFYVFGVVALVAFLLVRNLTRSRVGRSLVAIRDNETAAEVAGVRVDRTKVLTFGVSAAIAAVGGWMFAVLNNQVSPTSFTITLSITLLVAAVLGGAASIVGPLIGATVVVLLREVIPADSQRYSQVAFGVVLIVVMLVAPGGIVGIYRRAEAAIRRRRPLASASGSTGPDGSPDPAVPARPQEA
jgi:branched-chain amino acid transport system permease protein